MAVLHPRSVLQTAVLLLVLGLAWYTNLFESTLGQVIGGVILLIVGVDIVRFTWRRFG